MSDQNLGSTTDNVGPNDWYIDLMYESYVEDPSSVDEQWRAYFESVPRKAATEPQQQAEPIFDQVDKPQVEDAFSVEDNDPGKPAPAAGPPSVTGNLEIVTRSDLPPAPPAKVEEATSPYTRATRVGSAATLRASRMAAPEDELEPIRGVGRSIVKNMEASLAVPTATSAREIPAKLMIENRAVINNHLQKTVGGKISFTHLIGYALVEALVETPEMNVRFVEKDGKPFVDRLAHVGLGIAVDVPRADGTRSLLVPVIQNADTLTFSEFVSAMNDLIVRARDGKLTAGDFQGASVSLTNPGTLGTTHSVPRLMPGQGVIVGIGATTYPAEWQGAPAERLADLGVGKVMYATSTYDHRVIQGAGSGQFLRTFAVKLSGQDGFYDRVFDALHVPYPPYHWEADMVYDFEHEKGKQTRIAELIHAYRSRGHLAADLDPLAYRVRRHPDLELGRYGLTVWDLDRPFPTGGFGGVSQMVLRDMLVRLRDTYTRTIGIEYMHIQDPKQREWVQAQVEARYQKPPVEEQKKILSTLVQAEAFEEFLQTKYTGQKRFSLEGGESLIPLLDSILYDAAERGLYEVTIGMAHRGRLNVLANIAGKSYSQIFSEFEGSPHMRDSEGSGDVKYHLGTEGVYSAEDGVATKVYMAANPSHLEAVDGVLLGISRAKDDVLNDPSFPVLPVLIHGDAAFIGQGVVYETLNMSQLAGFRTGGSIHIIVNNQIGFTTGPTSGRSTRYATDLAKGLQVPIFHVNADDPEAVARVGKLAVEYREKFNKDVIIDLTCYRRRGHNEGDDPSMTQPVMYGLIDNLPSTLAVYTSNLVGRGDITAQEAAAVQNEYEEELTRILDETRSRGGIPDRIDGTKHMDHPAEQYGLEIPESQRAGAGVMIGWSSAVTGEEILRVGEAYNNFPEGFTPHKKMRQLSERRLKMAQGKVPIDWGFAELLAWGTMLMDGTPVRVTGQDARRATFVQRHAVLHDQDDGREFTPLDFLTTDQAKFSIYDSPLSEYAPLAFEYGYSVERPEVFVAWEAQFGDFANGAQTVIDEFISSADTKWGQRTSLTMLLPHGYEGQGPDHSSGRIERYLQLAADDNMWICQPSTPANHFHLTRIQAYNRPRRPLIEFTPKQLLRLTAATSTLEDLTTGTFKPVIGEVDQGIVGNADKVTRVLVCSGRVYYDLVKERTKRGRDDVAIVRVEQLYPAPVEELRAALSPFGNAEVLWVQDEPENQGPWYFLAINLFPQVGLMPQVVGSELPVGGLRPIGVVSRDSSPSPSTGLGWRHLEEVEEILRSSFE